MNLNKASQYGRHKAAMICLYCPNPATVALHEHRRINDGLIRADLQHKGTMLSRAPQTPAWLGINGFSTNREASTAVSPKQAASPKLKEELAANSKYRVLAGATGWSLVMIRRVKPQSMAVAGGRKAKHKTSSQNTGLPKNGENNAPGMYFCCPCPDNCD